ncbi:MAG: hypothetical protein M1814_003682 [Vezdaea aestivalis]|nr:MAG: hypothetical protein M1814_003682 [Vezdaea aestivalis]
MSKETIAFLGATAPSVTPTLASSLLAGNACRALARDPSKLTTSLKETYSIPTSTIDKLLTIIPGAIDTPSAIKTVLTDPSTSKSVPLIISGLGVPPPASANPLAFLGLKFTVCEEGAEKTVAAIKELGGKPTLVVLSTTGVSRVGRDVTLAFSPLYHILLRAPHVDKRAMEDHVEKAERDGILEGVVVRPSLLTDGEELGEGPGKLRVGWEGEGGKVAIGYTVSRKDVGGWLYRSLVSKGKEGRTEWVGRRVTLTY